MKTSTGTLTHFAPQITLQNVQEGIVFYQKAFGALELRRWENADGTVHVAEMAIDQALFHLHEETTRTRELSPGTLGGVTGCIGVFTADPDAMARRAITAGGLEERPMQDYDYGYRQGTIKDPFGHLWVLQKKIS